MLVFASWLRITKKLLSDLQRRAKYSDRFDFGSKNCKPLVIKIIVNGIGSLNLSRMR